MLFDPKIYAQERKAGTPAGQAYLVAKAASVPEEWPITEEDQTFEVGPFHVRVELKPDEMGTWEEACLAGTLEQARGQASQGYYTAKSFIRFDEGQFFNNGLTFLGGHGREDYFYVPDESVQSLVKYYRRSHSRHGAYLCALAQLKSQGEYAWEVVHDRVSFIGIVVTVSLDGERLGSASCWGIEFRDWRASGAHTSEIAQDLIREALDEARKAVPDAIKDHETRAAKLRAVEV